jgi:hypothetical protein
MEILPGRYLTVLCVLQNLFDNACTGDVYLAICSSNACVNGTTLYPYPPHQKRPQISIFFFFVERNK